MSVKLKKRSGKSKKKALDPARPFDPTLWARAEKMASEYAITIRKEPEAGGYLGRGVEFPYVMSDGPTSDACIDSTREAITLVIATMLEKGQTPPSPYSTETRNEQVNVRMSGFEKMLIDEAARSRGYRGISDFMRACALAGVR